MKYTGRSWSTSPYRMSGLTAGTSYIVQIDTYTKDGVYRAPVAAFYTLSMLNSSENVSPERRPWQLMCGLIYSFRQV